MTDTPRPPANLTEHGLSRSLGRLDTLTLGFGAIIGWSWIALISRLMVEAGSFGAIIATLAAGVVIIALGLIYGELASAMPKVGGEHAYSLRALGPDASFLCTWAITFAYVTVVAFEAVALPDVLEKLIPSLDSTKLWTINGSDVYLEEILIGSGTALVLMWLNILGLRLAAFVQTIVVCLIVLAGFVLFLGIPLGGDMHNADPLLVGGTSGVLAAMALVPFMMVGFDVIPQTAEEINLEAKYIGTLLVVSLALALLWYVLIELAVGMLVPAANREVGALSTIDAARVAWGDTGATLLIFGGVAGILTSWNSFLIGGSRALFALGASDMLPRWFAAVHPKHRSPTNAIIFVSGLAVFAPLFGRQAATWFVDAGSFGLMIAYLLVSASFIALRRDEPDMERPFRAPGGNALGYFGLVASVAMAALYLPGLPAALTWPVEWVMVIAWFVGGGLMYRAMKPKMSPHQG